MALSYTEMSSSGKIVLADVTDRMFPSTLEAVFNMYPTDACFLTRPVKTLKQSVSKYLEMTITI